MSNVLVFTAEAAIVSYLIYYRYGGNDPGHRKFGTTFCVVASVNVALFSCYYLLFFYGARVVEWTTLRYRYYVQGMGRDEGAPGHITSDSESGSSFNYSIISADPDQATDGSKPVRSVHSVHSVHSGRSRQSGDGSSNGYTRTGCF